MNLQSNQQMLPLVAGECGTGCASGGCRSSVGLCGSVSLPDAKRTGDEKRTDGFLEAPEHVLSTLERDGSRRWLRPQLSTGRWWRRRRWIAYALMVIFVLVPHIKIGGSPLLRLDIVGREFTFFGYTFLPTDTLLLALAMLTVFITIALVTAAAGRVWCGWACPQTVYMEFLFRPIDRLFERTIGKGGRSKRQLSFPIESARFGVYLFLSMFLAHTFLAYFVGPEQLASWMQSSPLEHPLAFAVMAVTTGLIIFDFYFFREQTCLIACPYGRFQSVMLDPHSLIVAYDYNRGEPRKKGKRKPEDEAGDCVDCNRCVVVCPTGIDIREGLQMECINCTQCIDACDDVMQRVHKPTGLIRFSSQAALEKQSSKLVRPRTVIYSMLLLVVASSLVYGIVTKSPFDARIVRGKGAPFTNVSRGLVSNVFELQLVNRSEAPRRYQIELIEPDRARVNILDESRLELEPGASSRVPMTIEFPPGLTFGSGRAPIELSVRETDGDQRSIQFGLLGPRQ